MPKPRKATLARIASLKKYNEKRKLEKLEKINKEKANEETQKEHKNIKKQKPKKIRVESSILIDRSDICFVSFQNLTILLNMLWCSSCGGKVELEPFRLSNEAISVTGNCSSCNQKFNWKNIESNELINIVDNQ